MRPKGKWEARWVVVEPVEVHIYKVCASPQSHAEFVCQRQPDMQRSSKPDVGEKPRRIIELHAHTMCEEVDQDEVWWHQTV